MAEIGQVLGKFEETLGRYAPQYLEGANPPISDEDLADLQAQIAPLKFPDSVIEIARWHDGGFAAESARERWLPLGEALGHRGLLREFARELGSNWPMPMMPVPNQWLPVSGAEVGGMNLIVELTPENRTDSHMWHFAQGDGPALGAEHSSVARYLEVCSAMHRRGEHEISVQLSKELDAGYGKHESVESYPEGWPERWDTTQ